MSANEEQELMPGPENVLRCLGDYFQEVGHAFVLLKPEGNITEEKLRSICKEKLANYKIPKKFNVQRSLPMLPVGKIDKRALKKMAAASRGKNDNKNSG